MRPLFRLIALALSLLLLIGCSSGPRVVPVKGVVTRGGKPVPSLSITFFPASDMRPSTGKTDDNGRFEMSFDRVTKGAAIGANKVVVAFRPRSPQEEDKLRAGEAVVFHPEQAAILEKYGKRDTSPLTVDITGPMDNLEIKLD